MTKSLDYAGAQHSKKYDKQRGKGRRQLILRAGAGAGASEHNEAYRKWHSTPQASRAALLRHNVAERR